MHQQRLFVRALAAIAVASPILFSAGAQSAGNVELGAFGQFTRTDAAWHLQNGFGAGGRIGVFLSRRWELEADASFSSFNNEAPRPSGSTSAQTYAGRLTYGVPFGAHQLLLEAGAGGQRFGGHQDFSFSPGGGFRFMLGDLVSLRFDGLVEYVENPTALTFAFPPAPGRNEKAARSTNVEIRAGLSLILGNRKPAPPPPQQVVQAPPTRTEPQPQQQPVATQPTPRPVDNSADSLNRVNNARRALLASVYFDFDRSELRDDQRAILDSKIPVLRANPGVRVRIEGNADERGSDEYNMALGQRRAQTARQYLIDHGIDAGRIDISSNGEERPVCQEHNESCWGQNRRDEFVIVAGGDSLRAP